MSAPELGKIWCHYHAMTVSTSVYFNNTLISCRIWLQQASRSLNTAATADSEAPPLACVGFDISDAHFPSTPRENMTFVKHDMLKPFPQEYHGTFDLVHLRLMVLALKKEQITTAAENAAALLSWYQAQKTFPHSRTQTNNGLRTRRICAMVGSRAGQAGIHADHAGHHDRQGRHARQLGCQGIGHHSVGRH